MTKNLPKPVKILISEQIALSAIQAVRQAIMEAG